MAANNNMSRAHCPILELTGRNNEVMEGIHHAIGAAAGEGQTGDIAQHGG